MRHIAISEAFARKLASLRAPRQDAPRIRVQDIEHIERELEVELPDAAVTYIAAGASVWGDGPVSFGKIIEQTLTVRELAVDLGMTERGSRRFVVIDDDASGNYIGVKKGTPKHSDRVYFLDHEGGFALDMPRSLSKELDEALEGRAVGSAVPPFTFVLVDEPAAPQRVPVVRHAKFGVGRVIADAGEYVTVAFNDAGTKRLKRSFLVFE